MLTKTFFHINRNNVDYDHFFLLCNSITGNDIRIGFNTAWATREIAAAAQSWIEYCHGIGCYVVEVDYR